MIQKLIIFGLILGSILTTSPANALLYFGSTNREAIVDFDYAVEIYSKVEPTAEEVMKTIHFQVLFLYGPLAESEHPAAPTKKYTITNVKMNLKADRKNTYEIRYHYQGIFAISNEHEGNTINVTLSRHPEKLWQSSLKEKWGSVRSTCTADKDVTEDKFWYDWDPYIKGCIQQEGRDYEIITAKVSYMRNTVRTYPEYERLNTKNGNILIYMLYGMDANWLKKDPNKSRDLNAISYRNMRNALLKLGYSSRFWDYEELKPYLGNTKNIKVSDLPSVEELTKQTPRGQITVRMYFGPSADIEEASIFHHFYADALYNSSVMIYDGHSGYGEYLDFEGIENYSHVRLVPNPNQYQIYFFNSCTSYVYYTDPFFNRKKTATDTLGTKNLDIIAAGLATTFDPGHETSMVIIRAVDLWATTGKRMSYQEMISSMDSGNLLSINGDEDNPTR